MSEENVEVVRKAFANLNAFMRGELTDEAAMELVDPQFEFRWHAGQTMPDMPQDLRGISAITEWVEQLRGVWTGLVFEPLELTDVSDDQVLTLARQVARGRESGVPLVTHFFELCTIRDGKVRKVELFRHRAEALEAAGLSE